MLHSLLIFILFIFIFERNTDFKKINKISFTVNLVITLMYFLIFFTIFKERIWSFYNFGIDSLIDNTKNIKINNGIQIPLSILFIIVSFYLSGLIISILMRRKRGINTLQKQIVPIWIIVSIWLSYYMILSGEENILFTVVLSSIITATFIIPTYFISKIFY